MKALVGTFNQEKALVGAFSVIVKTDCEIDGSFYSTSGEFLSLIMALLLSGVIEYRDLFGPSSATIPVNNK